MPLPANLKGTLSPISRIGLSFLNLIGIKNEFRIVVTSPNYMEIRLLWGVFSWEKGEKREFVIRGTEPYQKAVISKLESIGLKCSIC